MQKHIDEIMDRFNFRTVQIAMEAVGWKWSQGQGKESEVPDEPRLRECARELLEHCAKTEGENSRATGGFYAGKFLSLDSFSEEMVPQLRLDFTFESWETDRSFVDDMMEEKACAQK